MDTSVNDTAPKSHSAQAAVVLMEAYDVDNSLNLKTAAFEKYHTQVFHAWLKLDCQSRQTALSDRYVFFSLSCCIGTYLENLAKVDFGKANAFVHELMENLLYLAHGKDGYSEEWFRGLDQLADTLSDLNYLPEARSIVATGLRTGVSKFPRIAQSLSVQAAYLDSLIGRKEKAAKVALRLLSRPFLLPSRRELPKLYQKLMYVLSVSNHIEEYRIALWKGVSSVHANGSLRDAFAAQIVKTYRGAFRALLRSEVPLLWRVTFLLANAIRIIASRPILAALRVHAPLRYLHLASLYIVDYVTYGKPVLAKRRMKEKRIYLGGGIGRSKNARSKRILVTRAMGGIGDLLMMTPGLQALSLKFPRWQIDFAIPRSFHPIFAGFPKICLFDINEDEIDLTSYSRWFNLSDCPAGRIESRQYPNVRRNRIEIFARAMGISRWRIGSTVGFLPRYQVSAEEAAWARYYLLQINPAGLPVVGIQPFSADTYKNWPLMEDLAVELSRDHLVLIFHHEEVAGYNGARLHKVREPLRKSIALLAECYRLVAVDSSFVHIAAALDIKTVAVFGPTSGSVFCRYYPNVRYVMPRKSEFPCSPCWRNEHKPCHLTNRRESVCLNTITVERVLEAFSTNTSDWRQRRGLFDRFKSWVLYGQE
jgi:ADP-heptose:LPS heptosyltransferase